MSIFSSLLGRLSTVQITVFTWLNGKKVGTDSFGNVYYSARPRRGTKRERRWVLFKGEPEASKVPPLWHGWLHHQTDDIPDNAVDARKAWIAPHQPNLTGTPAAYFPPGDKRASGQRDRATGDYEAWQPPA